MSRRNLAGLIVAVLAAGAFVSCSEEAPVAPGGHGMHGGAAEVTTLALPEFFQFRGPLDPYLINDMPEFMIHSNVRRDIVIQRVQFPVGSGPWHFHPGPSFVGVIEGEVKVERFNSKDGCTETPVFVPGNAYFEVANEVHHLIVLSSTPAVLAVVRFNIPVGDNTTQPFTIMVPAPTC